MKVCGGYCKSELPFNKFSTDLSTKDGYRNNCNECRAKKRHQHDLKDLSRASDRRRKHRLKTEYGITPDQYDQMYSEQFGECKICSIHQSDLDRRLCIDHNHVTGKIRGLLCHKCNQALGLFNDSSDVLISAAKYLKG